MGLVAGIGLHLGERAFKRRHCSVHFLEALLCPGQAMMKLGRDVT
jgi:hypothetical protein